MTHKRYSTAIVARLFTLVTAACGATISQPPRQLPAGYEEYRPPPVCQDSAAPKTQPLPLNYDAVRRSASITHPDLVPRDTPTRIAFLWFFIREDGSVATTHLWKTSGSSQIDDIALDLGRQVMWRPATCGGQPVAGWYGHPMAVGGPSR